ncbi:MAG: class I SAM-dependent methyltransferase [Candidatus Vogelbacteria bacterium]|nr:class I SAM-dependent methyltransferase [Candidatus Vogelbacteria bacterium]
MKKFYSKQSKNARGFWNKEYKVGTHLALSNNPSEDLIKFTNWLKRNDNLIKLNSRASVLDLGCGNGRNLIYLAKTYGLRGVGYDISLEAIKQAESLSKDLRLKYEMKSIAGRIDLPDNSQTIVLDMMTSHFLNESERKSLIKEIYRVLIPGGWLYLKTFFKEEDINAIRLLREHPAEEKGSYIHPKIGVAEHVFTEDEIKENLKENYEIWKMLRSHRHIDNGHASKRRSISVYARKI